jgi:hypothetical protein
MNSSDIAYQALMLETGSPAVTSLMAFTDKESFQAVMWHATRHEWIYAPGIAVGLLYDDEYADEQITVDRPTAERLAREHLQTELPSVETILAMYEEGARNGWTYGPPRN